MTGVMQTLFGGSTSESQQTSKPIDTTPEEFQALRDPLAQALQGLIGAPLAQGGGAFAGPLAAPITGQEAGLVTQAGQQAGANPFSDAITQLLQKTISGQFLDPASNPFLGQTIQAAIRPLIETFQDVAQPQLQSAFTAAGQRTQPGGSSAFDKAAAISTRGLLQQIGDVTTNIAGQNFQAERQRQMEAATQAGAIRQQDLQATVTGLQASALPRLISDLGIERGIAEFRARLDTVIKAIQLAGGLTFEQGQVSQGTSSSTSQEGMFPGGVPGMIGMFTPTVAGAATGAAPGAGATGLGPQFTDTGTDVRSQGSF